MRADVYLEPTAGSCWSRVSLNRRSKSDVVAPAGKFAGNRHSPHSLVSTVVSAVVFSDKAVFFLLFTLLFGSG